MNLTITADLVRELDDQIRRSRPENTGIVLTADGWAVEVWTSPSSPWPVALTGDDLHGLLDGEDLDDDLAEAFTEPDGTDGNTTYAVPFEDGEHDRVAKAAAEPQVITARMLDADDPLVEQLDWSECRWFDLGGATRLLTTRGARDAYGRDSELWVTAGGQYRARRTSRHVNDPGMYWAEMSAEQAAGWLFTADGDHLDWDMYGAHGHLRGDAPAIVVGARALRTAADAVTAPAVPVTRLANDTLYHPDRVADEALRVQETAAALTILARDVVAPRLRSVRRDAVRILVDAYDGQTGAAEAMGVSQPTVSRALK